MIIVLFRGGRGAALTLAHAEQDEFTNELIIASQRLAKAKVEDGEPGPGGQIPMGSELVEVAVDDVAIVVAFDPEPVIGYHLAARPTNDQFRVASVVLDEMARFHLRQRMMEVAQAQAAQAQQIKRGLHVVQQHIKEPVQ